MKRRLIVVPGILLAASFASAQGPVGIPDGEIPGLIRALDGAGRQAASDRLMGVTAPQLVLIYEALEGEEVSGESKSQLEKLLPKIQARFRKPQTKPDYVINQEEVEGWRADYEKLAVHNPRWDESVQRGFDSLATGDEQQTVHFRGAINGGSTDPVVRYYAYTGGIDRWLKLAEALPLLDKVARDMDASQYPATRKFYANMKLAQLALKDPAHTIPATRIDDAIQKAMRQLPPMFKTELSHFRRVESLAGLIDVMITKDPTLTIDTALQIVLPITDRKFDTEAEAEAFGAVICVELAWIARGSSFSPTPEQLRIFQERLRLARQKVEQGWKKDPSIPHFAVAMVNMAKGDGSSRAEMEKWFRRAMLADQNNVPACIAKMDYLFPKWRGSLDDVLQFSRECVATGTAANRIPMIMVIAHKDLCAYAALPDAPTEEYVVRYYSKPEVWADIKLAFDKMLADKSRLQTDRMGYLRDRASYVRLAHNAKNWKVVLALTEEYGEEIDKRGFPQGYANMIATARKELGLPSEEELAAAARRAARGAVVEPKAGASRFPGISLQVKDVPLAMVIADLNKQVEGETPMQLQPAVSGTIATLNADNQPYWEVVTQLQKQYSLKLTANANLTLGGTGQAPIASQISGDVMMQVLPFGASPTNVAMNLLVGFDPRLSQVPAIVEVRDVFDEADRLWKDMARAKLGARTAFTTSLSLGAIPANFGKKVAFNARVRYLVPVKWAKQTIEDVQNNLNKPVNYGNRTFTPTRVNINGQRMAIGLESKIATPAGDDKTLTLRAFNTKMSVYDADNKLLYTQSFGEINMSQAQTVPEFKGPIRVVLEVPEEAREESVEFLFRDIATPTTPAGRAGVPPGAPAGAPPPANRAGNPSSPPANRGTAPSTAPANRGALRGGR